MAPAAQRITIVRMKVAKSEPTFSTPTLAKIAVSAANAAERTAQNCQDEERFFMSQDHVRAARRARPMSPSFTDAAAKSRGVEIEHEVSARPGRGRGPGIGSERTGLWRARKNASQVLTALSSACIMAAMRTILTPADTVPNMRHFALRNLH